MKTLACRLLACCTVPILNLVGVAQGPVDTLIEAGSDGRFNDSKSDPDTNWADPYFADTEWDTEIAVLNLAVPGDNVLAVEVHQGKASSSDLSFDLELRGAYRAPTVSIRSLTGSGTPSGAGLLATRRRGSGAGPLPKDLGASLHDLCPDQIPSGLRCFQRPAARRALGHHLRLVAHGRVSGRVGVLRRVLETAL